MDVQVYEEQGTVPSKTVLCIVIANMIYNLSIPYTKTKGNVKIFSSFENKMASFVFAVAMGLHCRPY